MITHPDSIEDMRARFDRIVSVDHRERDACRRDRSGAIQGHRRESLAEQPRVRHRVALVDLAVATGRIRARIEPKVKKKAEDILKRLGVSHSTFITMSYVVDVYRRQYPAERSLTILLGYVLFFGD